MGLGQSLSISNFTIQSFCKVNLGLKVINKRYDGYHNISSIFIELDLFDTLKFIPSDCFEIKFLNANIPSENTVSKATGLISKLYNINIGYKILIDKKIPIGAGLGGGSSNAAYTLKMLNKIYSLNLKNSSLEKLGKEIGGDVPFFINGGIKKISGIGDIIKNINSDSIKDKIFLLVFPNFSISTTWAYEKIKKHLSSNKINPKFPPLTNKVDWTLFENDFEHIVCLAYPEILDIKSALYKSGALYSGLSGSGSTMFGIYNDIDTAKVAIKNLHQYQTHIASPRI